ncbi:4Fe-4S binding protein [Candidatus Omnitrophota bacterium]
MRYPKLRELKEAVKALIKGPYTSKFPFEAHEPFEGFKGKPEFHDDDCIGCGACAQVCPAKAIEFKDEVRSEGAKRTLTFSWDTCIFCGQCQANCPTEKGITLSKEFDLATTGKREELKQSVEKKLLLCECCGEVIAPYEQIIWVAKRLGPLSFSNPSLMIAYLKDLELAKKEASPSKETKKARSDRIKILCPRCRREAALKS